LCEIWKKALGLARIGVLDGYSAIGGDSLTAIKIITEIHKSFGVELSPKCVFQFQTIRKLSEQLALMSRQESSYHPIPKAPEQVCYPVSTAQKRQYILNQVDGGVSYNLPGGLLLEGRVDAGRLENAFRTIISRHEALRTSFELRDGLPVQLVHETVEFSVEHMEAREAELDRLMASFVRPFDLSAAPLMRARLIRITENRHVLLFDMHHIISDGASINLLIEAFTKLYNGISLPELKIQYKDYSVWHNALLKSGKIKKQEAYWLERFSGEIPVLNMPLDFARPSIQSFRGNRLHFTLDEKLTKQIRQLTAKTGTTLFMFLLSSYNVLLSKYTGQEDIVVGTPVEGRGHRDLRELIGMFVNTLAIRSCPAGDKPFEVFLNEVKDDLLNAFDHQEYPFEQLVEKAGVKRDTSRNPLFDTVFVLQNMALTKLEADGLTAEPYIYNNGTSKFDLTLEAVDKGDTIGCSFEYCTDLFTEETIRRLAGHYINAINDIAENPSKRISDITILSDEERRQLLCRFNDTDADYPSGMTIHQIFEEQAAKTPDNTALVFKDARMTYKELNERANSLARTLRANGVGPDAIVGLIIDRSLEMIVAILGVLKAGGAYMPIDPDYPAERKAYMLEDSGAKVLLTKRSCAGDIPYGGTIIDLNDASSFSPDVSNPDIASKPEHLAYIIYTSGSTGRPKGVMIEHRNVVRLLFNDKFQFDFNDKDVWTLFHSYCFDFSVWEMYGALLYGGRLIIVPREAAV
ncbi:MAG: AMP-binding protein, partial [Clostridiales bacterium]|nr:AMP-binding protein [Clostridiales bacterium]